MDQPIGLQRLSELQCLEVHSTMTWMSGSRYEIKECSGEPLYDVKKERKGLINISFNMTLVDVNGVEVISLHRPSSLGMGKLNVSMQGELVSIVRPKVALKPKYEIQDASGTPVYKIKGPWCSCSMDLLLQLLTLDETPVGTITREWRGWRRELRAQEDFIVSFPPGLELRYKAACIAAAVLIIDTRWHQR